MTLMTRFLLGVACAAAVPMVVLAQDMPQDARAWLDRAAQASSDRLIGVDHYVERVHGGAMPGLSAVLGQGQQDRCITCRTNTVEEITLPDGTSQRVPHLLSPMEAAVLSGVSPQMGTVVGMSQGMQIMQDQFMSKSDEWAGPWSGIIGTLFGDVSGDSEAIAEDIENKSWEQDERETPWLNPFRLFGAGAYMYSETAVALGQAQTGLANRSNESQTEADSISAMLDNAQLAGLENVEGQPAMRIDLPIPSHSQNASTEPSFTPTNASIWIEPEKYVIVQHRVIGLATADGESREFLIESRNLDYRNVPDSNMYEPYKRVMRMGGIMDDEQLAQMEEARKQLEDFDRQMAEMPPDQRKMVEDMMGSQMATIRSLASDGVFEHVEIIDEILVNPDLNALYGGGSGSPTPKNLVQQIQEYLVILNYEPGNTDGVLDTMTQIAISQFQAEQAITVTGEATLQLAGVLAAEIDRRR